MKDITSVRHTLGEFVSEAFIDLPNEEVAQAGDHPATPIWNNGAQEPGLTADNANELGGDVDDTPPHYEFAAEADIDVERALGSGLGDHVSRAAMVKGVDGLAWYVSFHAQGPQWGDLPACQQHRWRSGNSLRGNDARSVSQDAAGGACHASARVVSFRR